MTSPLPNWLKKELGSDAELREMLREESLNADIAIQIYNARTEAGLTQEQLAKRINTQQTVISRLEDADYQGHSVSMLQKVFTALGKGMQITTNPGSAIDLDSDLACGGRLRDYIPIVQFASQRLTATFPAELQSRQLEPYGLEGVLRANQEYETADTPFGQFAVSYIRESILEEIQRLRGIGNLQPKKVHPKLRFGEFHKEFFTKTLKIPESVTRKVIHNFDQFQSVRLPEGHTDNQLGQGVREVLFFSKALQEQNTRTMFLSLACQSDHDLLVTETYRVHSKLTEGVFEMPPLDLFRAFLERFGLDVKVGDQRSRFIMRETVKLRSRSITNLAKIVAAPSKRNNAFFNTMLKVHRPASGLTEVECALVYCIDKSKYLRWGKPSKR